MRMWLLALVVIVLILPASALTEYQRGVLDGLSRGWSMAQKYDQALAGRPSEFNQAVPEFNAWIESIFGGNESLMLKPVNEPAIAQPFSIHKTFKPVHQIDASWNQTQSLLPQPDERGLINGWPAETYYSWGPALNYI